MKVWLMDELALAIALRSWQANLTAREDENAANMAVERVVSFLHSLEATPLLVRVPQVPQATVDIVKSAETP